MSTPIDVTFKRLPKGTILKGLSYEYKIVETLGQGAFGITYLASVKMAGALGSLDTGVLVAIKEFFMKEVNGRQDTTVTSGNETGAFQYYKSKFLTEALNLAKLDHPNIVKVIETFEANNTAYYVMEFIRGGSLEDYIRQHGSLTPEKTIVFSKDIAGALEYMHAHNMLHLDLKPANIMLDENAHPKIIDFGLSKQFNETGQPETSTSIGLGTPGYAPLEQANFKGQNSASLPVTMDIYALGGTMFKLVTGQRPPEASEILNEGFPEGDLKNIDPNLKDVIRISMSPLKKDRYQSVSILLEALGNISPVNPVPPLKIPNKKEITKEKVKAHNDDEVIVMEATPEYRKGSHSVTTPDYEESVVAFDPNSRKRKERRPLDLSPREKIFMKNGFYRLLYNEKSRGATVRFFLYFLIGLIMYLTYIVAYNKYWPGKANLRWGIFVMFIIFISLAFIWTSMVNTYFTVRNNEKQKFAKILWNIIFILGFALLAYGSFADLIGI